MAGLVERAEAKLQQVVQRQRQLETQELVKVIGEAMKVSEEQLLRRVEKELVKLESPERLKVAVKRAEDMAYQVEKALERTRKLEEECKSILGSGRTTEHPEAFL